MDNNNAWAGIDVSGLPREAGGGGGANNNAALASQLRVYVGSGATRFKEVQQQQQQAAMPSTTTSTTTTPTTSNGRTAGGEPVVATWAYRANPGFNPRLTRTGPLGNLYQLNDMVEATMGSKRRSIGIQFEFPNDWLQLDRNIGGIQYVDQRNGDKLYVFRASLPTDTSLEDLPTPFWELHNLANPTALAKESKQCVRTTLNPGVGTILAGSNWRVVSLESASLPLFDVVNLECFGVVVFF